MRRSVALALLLVFVVGGVSPARRAPQAHAAIGDDARRLGPHLIYTLSPGQQQAFFVSFQNTGTTTWRSFSGPYRLGEDFGHQLYTIPLASDPVAPGQVVSWSFVVTAPSTAGVYGLSFQMTDTTPFFGGKFGDFLLVEITVVGSSSTATPTLPPAATATSTPIVPPTATRTPAPLGLSCTPRPPVNVAAVPNGDGRLRITLTTSANPASAPNLLQALQVGALDNAVVELGGQVGISGTVALPATTSTTFYVRRVNPGAAAHATLTVVDGCGSWPTFVGGGASAF